MASVADDSAPVAPASRQSGIVAEDRSASLAKAPVQLFLAVVGLLWLVPTFGLFITSLLPPSDFATAGWWKVFSNPSLLDARQLQRSSSTTTGRSRARS